MEIPKFDTQKELIVFLVKNKETLMAQKKAELKCADGFLHIHTINKKGELTIVKNNDPVEVDEVDKLEVTVIVNTTNLMDSHFDVHIPGLWNKSIQENKYIMHIQEHRMSSFDKIISEGKDLDVFTKNFTWKNLGFDFKGKTEALVFKSIVRKSRNKFMFNQYADGFVKNHSVGMRYVKLVLAVNDDEWGAEFEAWEKYLPQIANKEVAEEHGFFWVVKEAKLIEGSAVPLGSNFVTPTLTVQAKDESIISMEIQLLTKLSKQFTEPFEPSMDTPNTLNERLDFLQSLKNNLNK